MNPVIPLALMGTWYGYAAASDPDDTPYDRVFIRAGAAVVGSAMGAWLAHQKSKLAIPVTLATGVGTVVAGLIDQRRHGTYVRRTWKEGSWRDKVFNKAMPVAHVALVAAEAADAMLSLARHATQSAVVAKVPRLLSNHRHYPLLRKLSLYYMGFSLVGHWGEMLFCTGIKHGVFKGDYDRTNHMLWDQWLFPFPAEGTAAVLISLFLYPFKDRLQGHARWLTNTGIITAAQELPIALSASFLINQLVCTAIDYGTGMVANRNYELWDYRDMPYNFQGQICLQNSLFYTLVATWGVWRLFPIMERRLARTDELAIEGQLVSFGSIFLMLELLYHVVPRDVEGFVQALRGLGQGSQPRLGSEPEPEPKPEQEPDHGASLLAHSDSGSSKSS